MIAIGIGRGAICDEYVPTGYHSATIGAERRSCRSDRTGDTVPGHISEQRTVGRYDGVLSAIYRLVYAVEPIISHEPPVFNRFFIFLRIFGE